MHTQIGVLYGIQFFNFCPSSNLSQSCFLFYCMQIINSYLETVWGIYSLRSNEAALFKHSNLDKVIRLLVLVHCHCHSSLQQLVQVHECMNKLVSNDVLSSSTTIVAIICLLFHFVCANAYSKFLYHQGSLQQKIELNN